MGSHQIQARLVFRHFSLTQEPEATQASHAAIAAQKQPRKGRGPVGPSEYATKVAVTIPAADPPQEIPTKAPQGLQGIPIGSKLLWSREVLKGGSWVREVEYGVFHTPEVFLEKSLKMAHPFDSPVSMDAPNMRAIATILSEGVEGIKAKRKAALDYYCARKVALQKDELALKAKMHPDVRGVMQPKNLLLFKEMLRDACVGDDHLFHDLTSGFRITGELEPSGQFPPKCKVAALSVADLRKTAKWAKHLVASSCCRAAKDKAVAKAVWKESLDQVQRGWLRGPFSSSEIDARVGPEWVASKRFGIVQGEKIRAVDDLSEYMVNSTVSESEKIVLDGVDEILAVARFFGGATTGGVPEFKIPAPDGSVFRGRLHDDFRKGRSRLLRGRALDLKSAYKQLACHPEDRWASVLAVLDVDRDRVMFFESLALPFGATSSVTGFNRTARALRIIMIRLFCLVCTSFYDDFCQLELLDLVESASDTALSLLELLGWEVAKGDKLKGFADAFNMLAARISFAEVPKGLVMVSNKPGRLEDIEKLLGAMAARGKGALDLVPSLKGKLLFAASHVFGKCSQIAIQAIRQCETGMGHMSEVSSVVRLAERALALLRSSGPRSVSLWSEQPPVVVYTDGACEAESITMGAVLVDLSSGTKEFFGCPVPEALVLKWRRSGRTQLIFFTEILPVLVAKKTWSEILKNRRVFFYIDNEATGFLAPS